jgi:protein required for attachment to host cells
MPPTRWIVVADRSRARIFAAQETQARFEEIADFANPEGRSKDGEIGTYVSGEGARPGPRTAPQQDSLSDHSVDTFSHDLAQYLEKARTEHRYDSLYLIAAPKLLGSLRNAMSVDVRKLVAGESDKDVAWVGGREIERYLKEALTVQ